MKQSDVTQKLSLLQDRLVRYRGRSELVAMLEETYWREVGRLRSLGGYEELPGYVVWLARYHGVEPDDRAKVFKGVLPGGVSYGE